MILHNDYVEKYIYCNEYVFPKKLEEFGVAELPINKPFWFSFIDQFGIQIRYYCSLNEVVYAAITGILKTKNINSDTRQSIENLYPQHFKYLKAFYDKYPMGLKYPELL